MPSLAEDVQSLHRTGNALVLSVVVTLGFGVLYWLVAAHLYSRRTVGLNAAAVSVMMLLAGISQLNLTSTLARFVPRARCRTHVLVRTAYLVSVTAAALVSVTFLLGVSWWAPRLEFFADDPRLFVVFVLTTMSWCVFNMQDSVLAGIGRPMWVPLENGAFAIVKTVLAVALVALADRSGIFSSWPARWSRSWCRSTSCCSRVFSNSTSAASVSSRRSTPLPSFSTAGDFVGPLLLLAASAAMPILVTNELGPVANSVVRAVWVITHTLYLLAAQMAVALVLNTSDSGSGLGERSYPRSHIQRASACLRSVCSFSPRIRFSASSAPDTPPPARQRSGCSRSLPSPTW